MLTDSNGLVTAFDDFVATSLVSGAFAATLDLVSTILAFRFIGLLLEGSNCVGVARGSLALLSERVIYKWQLRGSKIRFCNPGRNAVFILRYYCACTVQAYAPALCLFRNVPCDLAVTQTFSTPIPPFFVSKRS